MFTVWRELVKYEDKYRLCYVRGSEGIIIAMAEQLSSSVRPASVLDLRDGA
jgi:hypothetical protein